MGVIDPAKVHEWPFDEIYDQRCFMCGKPVQLPAVYWHGVPSDIVLVEAHAKRPDATPSR